MEENMRILVENTIKKEFGAIDALPEEVGSLLWGVFHEFLSAYIEIIRNTEKRPAEWRPTEVNIDEGVLGDMQHFFSDYQHIVKRYQKVREQAKGLLKINPRENPSLYEEQIKEILSKEEKDSILSQLEEP